MDDLWKVYRRFLEDLCLEDLCLEDLWRIYERFMEDLWKIYGGLIEALWRIYDGFPPQGCFFLVAAPLGLGFVSYGFLTDIRHVFMMDLWMIYEGFIDDF